MSDLENYKPTADWAQLAAQLQDQLAKASSDFQKQFSEALASLQQFAGKWHTFFEALAPELAKIDISEVTRNFESASDALDTAGWTIPSWLDFTDFVDLGGKAPEEVNEYLSDTMAANDFEYLRKLEAELLQRPALYQWHSLLREVVDSVCAGRYLVAIPAAISIIEGYIANCLVTASLIPAKTTSPVGKFLGKQWHHKREFDVFFWKSGTRFLENLFANSDFGATEPTFINRHWILHGRSAVTWTQADALRLINAIDTICDLFNRGLPKAALQALQPSTPIGP